MPGWQSLTEICDGVTKPCHFPEFIALIKAGISDMVILSTFIAIVIFIVAGFRLLAAQGKPGALAEARGMLLKVVIGYAVIILAWVVVYTLTSTFLYSDFTFLLSQ